MTSTKDPRKIEIGVYGASGRMGRSVIAAVESSYHELAAVVAPVDRSNGRSEDLMAVDAIIDFSLPAGTSELLDYLGSESGRLPVYLCGTTGLTNDHYARMKMLSERTLVLQTTNFSTGVAAVSALLKYAAPMLKSLSYVPQIIETHHVHKIDAPSGTAKSLAEVVSPTEHNAIDIQSIRDGEVIGKHDVVFAGVADQILISHEASDRSLFARGAIDAALWLCQLDTLCGLYTMETYFSERFSG